MVERILSFKKVSDYLEGLSNKNHDIKSFFGDNPQLLDDALGSVEGMKGPALSFYGYKWSMSGNNQRTFNTRSLSFAIIIAGVKPEDYAGQDDAIEKAESIGLEVLSRIYQDSLRPEINWLYNNFEKESVSGVPVRLEKDEGLFGMDFSFNLKVSEPLVVDKSKWSDGDLFCG